MVLFGLCSSFTKEAKIQIPPPPCDHFQRGKYPLFFTLTTSGYVDTQLWFNISTKLCELIFPHLYVAECLLFLDNFSPHLSIGSLKLLYEHNMHCMFLPPNTTHWIQPLDNKPNACLKNCIKSIKRKRYNCSNLTQSNKYHLLTNISIEAIDKSFKKDVIIKSFTETGVWPFDEDKILKRSLENLGIKSNINTEKTEQKHLKDFIDISIDMIRRNMGNLFEEEQIIEIPLDNKIYFGDELISISQKKQHEMEEKKNQKERNKLAKQQETDLIRKERIEKKNSKERRKRRIN